MQTMHPTLFVFSIVLLAVSPAIDGANILAIFPTISKSHAAIGQALSVGLAKAGHNVTLVNVFKYKPAHPSVEAVLLDGVEEQYAEISQHWSSLADMSVVQLLPVFFYIQSDVSNATLHHPQMQHLMHTRTYDLVIVDLFVDEALLGLGQHFAAPVVAVSGFGANKWVNDLVGTPSPPSYVAHAWSAHSDRMNLYERLINLLLTFYENLCVRLINEPAQRLTYNTAFPGARLTYDEVLQNVSLVLVNSHFSLLAPRPYVPNMIEVGGLHVQRESQPLPSKLRRFVDEAPHGVIYFSLGSVAQSAAMPRELRDTFVRVFASLPQRVLWKYEERLDGLPANVLIDKWMPQNDLLAHPQVRVFMSHGGLLSSLEAVYHGVPVVGIPQFGDQMRNTRALVQMGCGVQLDMQNLTEASLRWALETALSDGVAEQTQRVSERYRDQPQTPLQTAVYWIEYVLRHRGAPHLRSAGMDLNFWQYHCLDAFAIFLVGFAGLVVTGYWMLRHLLGYLLRSNNLSKTKIH